MKDIQQQFISYNKSSRSVAPQYIVMHDTGDPGGSAQNEHDYFSGGNRNASADFFVDSDNIIQIIDTDAYYSWHCGDGHGIYGITNANSLGIEMCLELDGNPSEDTVRNTLELVKYLMDKYNIHFDHVVRHYDASRKSCPCSFMNNSWARWYDFKNQLANGANVTGEWELQDNKWWYKCSDSTYPKDCWLKIEGTWYLFDAEGYMLYDWKSDEGKWYYLGDANDGAMKTGWVYDKKACKWYYCNEHGEMQKGWIKVEGRWYYLDSSGAMKTGWINDNGKDYCLYSSGEIIANTVAYGYKFDSSGVATRLS